MTASDLMVFAALGVVGIVAVLLATGGVLWAVGHAVHGRPAPTGPGPSRPPRTTGPRSRRPAQRRRHAKPKRTTVAPPRGLEVPPRPTTPPPVPQRHDADTVTLPRVPAPRHSHKDAA